MIFLLHKITPCFENGKGAIARNLTNGVGFGSTEFMVLNDYNSLGIEHFVKYVTQNKRFRKIGAPQMIGGGGQRRIPKDFVLNYPIIDTNINSYILIGKALSQQENQVNKVKTLIEKLEKRNQYYAERLLSGELRVRECDDGRVEFYENTEWKTITSNVRKNGELKSPIDWNSISLENIFTNSVGGEYGKELTDGNIDLKTNIITLHIFGGKNIEKSLIQRAVEPNKLRSRIVSNGDIIIEKSGGTDNCSVGRVYLAEGISTPTTSVNFTNILKLNNELFESHYVFELLNIFHRLRIAAKYEQKTVGIANLKQGEYFKLKYMFPDKKEQVVISKAIKQLDKEKKTVELLLEKEQKRFDWMSDALLSGEYQIVD